MNENNDSTFPALTADITAAPPPRSIRSRRYRFGWPDDAGIPHEYVVRSPENAEAYVALFKLIGENAVPEEWRGRPMVLACRGWLEVLAAGGLSLDH